MQDIRYFKRRDSRRWEERGEEIKMHTNTCPLLTKQSGGEAEKKIGEHITKFSIALAEEAT